MVIEQAWRELGICRNLFYNNDDCYTAERFNITPAL
ncbi:MAG: hypothetical protein ACI9CE_001989 [Flavobacterium sp.]|jgi:hypothetical protein